MALDANELLRDDRKVLTPAKLQKEYRWWFFDVIQNAVETSAKEDHPGTSERLVSVPGESFKQYVDEDGHVFEVNVSVEYLGADW